MAEHKDAVPCGPAMSSLDGSALAATASMLGVMSHPARLAALLLLDRDGPRTVGELCEALALEQSALSHHLRLLRDADLVRREARGRHRVYHLADAHVGHIVRDALAHAAEAQGSRTSQ